jgi:hypothetical protein
MRNKRYRRTLQQGLLPPADKTPARIIQPNRQRLYYAVTCIECGEPIASVTRQYSSAGLYLPRHESPATLIAKAPKDYGMIRLGDCLRLATPFNPCCCLWGV